MGGGQVGGHVSGQAEALLPHPQAAGGASQAACDGNRVAGHGGGARQQRRPGAVRRRAHHGHCDEEDGGAYRVAPDYRAAVFAARLGHAGAHALQARDGYVAAQPQGDECVDRLAAHRGDVAQVDGHRLPAEVLPGSGPQGEVDGLDHRVGGGHRGAGGGVPGRGVVAYAVQEAVPGARLRGRPFDKLRANGLGGLGANGSCGTGLSERRSRASAPRRPRPSGRSARTRSCHAPAWESTRMDRTSGRARDQSLKAGMTSLPNQASCSRTTLCGVPTAWPTLTCSMPGKRCSSSWRRSTMRSGGPQSQTPSLTASRREGRSAATAVAGSSSDVDLLVGDAAHEAQGREHLDVLLEEGRCLGYRLLLRVGQVHRDAYGEVPAHLGLPSGPAAGRPSTRRRPAGSGRRPPRHR